MLEWVRIENIIPKEAGWYRVMVHGDSEYLDGHIIYDYPDYETWAQWIPADENEYEDFDGGYKGNWYSMHDEEGESIFAYAGPVEVPVPFKIWEKNQNDRTS